MYNANPNYEMDFMILKDVNEHMEGLFQRFSKLLPFRIEPPRKSWRLNSLRKR